MAISEAINEMLNEQATNSEHPVCVIDQETRTITVPPEYQLFGVENDKRVERIYFQCPKIVGDNQDLSQNYQLFINYQNANGDPDAYHIDDMEIDGDNITFSWLLEENVTKYRGNIQFAFGAIIPGDEAEDPDKNRWNTTINADCTCLVGLKSTQQVAESNPDAIVQIWAAIDELKAGGGGSGTPGKDGREIEIQNNGTAIQWRYVGDSDWTDLVQLSDLKGEKGDKGDKGEKGDTGATPNIRIGTVQTLEPGQQATANMTGTPENPMLNLGIPKGENAEGNSYELPIMSSTQLGGGKAVSKTDEDVPVAVDPLTGQLFVPTYPENTGGGGGTSDYNDLENLIENYYALRRTGKVYQTKIWKFASNPTPTGEKLLDNAGLVFEPSTDTTEGQDDYLNGQNPLFEWVHCNYTRDADGTARPTAIEGMSNYATIGAVDVGVMQMSFWWKWDTSNADYDLITISDTPHPELGLVPWTECKKADDTVVPWCIGSAYISGIASDGKLRSQPGLKPERNQSHNNMITNYQAKGEGYWGAGAVRNTFQIIFNIIKGATKSSQALYAGCTSYSFQYEAAVQSEEANTYFPVTNAQAENIPVGCYVSVGYGGNNSGVANNDREQATIHAYVDDVKVINKVAMDDGANTAIYLDIPEESAFNTQPHIYTESFSAPIMLSSMHAWSGTTDTVLGHHDGSPVSNTDGKHAYRVQGREYTVGGYIVASDTVIDLQPDFTKKVYVAPKGTVHSSSDATIRSTYTHIGTIPAATAENNADWWIGDFGLSTDVGGWWPATEGSGSSQGTGDRCHAGGASATSGTREYLQGGDLGNGAYAGSASLNCWIGLDWGAWMYLACD